MVSNIIFASHGSPRRDTDDTPLQLRWLLHVVKWLVPGDPADKEQLGLKCRAAEARAPGSQPPHCLKTPSPGQLRNTPALTSGTLQRR